MNNSISEQFRAALNFLLHQEGRGAQVRLSVTQNIDRGYLNAVIKGRKPGAEEIRLKIADHFGMTYEAMLTLGRVVQNGTVLQGQAVSPRLRLPSEGEGGIGKEDQRPDSSKANILQHALEVLTSGTEYSTILQEMITVLHKAVQDGSENEDMARKVQMLEERMEKLELLVNENMIEEKAKNTRLIG